MIFLLGFLRFLRIGGFGFLRTWFQVFLRIGFFRFSKDLRLSVSPGLDFLRFSQDLDTSAFSGFGYFGFLRIGFRSFDNTKMARNRAICESLRSVSKYRRFSGFSIDKRNLSHRNPSVPPRSLRETSSVRNSLASSSYSKTPSARNKKSTRKPPP